MAAYSSCISINSSGFSQSRRTVWREWKPCLREFFEDFSRVSAVFGPRDFAPLARAVSERNCDGIYLYSLCFESTPTLSHFVLTFSYLIDYTAIINYYRSISNSPD